MCCDVDIRTNKEDKDYIPKTSGDDNSQIAHVKTLLRATNNGERHIQMTKILKRINMDMSNKKVS